MSQLGDRKVSIVISLFLKTRAVVGGSRDNPNSNTKLFDMCQNVMKYANSISNKNIQVFLGVNYTEDSDKKCLGYLKKESDRNQFITFVRRNNNLGGWSYGLFDYVFRQERDNGYDYFIFYEDDQVSKYGWDENVISNSIMTMENNNEIGFFASIGVNKRDPFKRIGTCSAHNGTGMSSTKILGEVCDKWGQLNWSKVEGGFIHNGYGDKIQVTGLTRPQMVERALEFLPQYTEDVTSSYNRKVQAAFSEVDFTDSICKLGYGIYEERGGPGGKGVLHWRTAK